MDKKKQSSSQADQNKSHVSDAACALLNEGKKFVNEVYVDGLNRACQAEADIEANLKEYSDELVNKIQKNPLSAVLIAGGIGFMLSVLLRK